MNFGKQRTFDRDRGFGKFRAFGSVAARNVVADGRQVRSYWDTCASHNFVSTRLAAELIARGARYQRTELPILQGVIHAGVSRLKILIDLDVVHQGRIIRIHDEQFWVWDMGADLTFSNVLLEEEGLLPATPGLQDEQLLSQFVRRGGEFEAGEDESTLLLHLQERSNYARERLVDPASLRHVAQLGPEIPKDMVCPDAHEDLVKRFASSVANETSKAHLDAFSLEKILEIRRLLLKQLGTPDAECLKRCRTLSLTLMTWHSAQTRWKSFVKSLKPCWS